MADIDLSATPVTDVATTGLNDGGISFDREMFEEATAEFKSLWDAVIQDFEGIYAQLKTIRAEGGSLGDTLATGIASYESIINGLTFPDAVSQLFVKIATTLNMSEDKANKLFGGLSEAFKGLAGGAIAVGSALKENYSVEQTGVESYNGGYTIGKIAGNYADATVKSIQDVSKFISNVTGKSTVKASLEDFVGNAVGTISTVFSNVVNKISSGRQTNGTRIVNFLLGKSNS